MRNLFTAAMLAASASAAFAGGTYDSTGTATGQSSAQIIPLAENHLVMMLPSTQTGFEMEAEGHPFAGMSGSCNGALEILNGAALGQGLCVYEDGAGDTIAVRWTGENMTAEGALHGQWTIIGGTGGLTGMTGGGDFINVTDRETGEAALTLTGAVSTQ